MRGAAPTSELTANEEMLGESAPTATLSIGAGTDPLPGPLPHHLLAMAKSFSLPTCTSSHTSRTAYSLHRGMHQPYPKAYRTYHHKVTLLFNPNCTVPYPASSF